MTTILQQKVGQIRRGSIGSSYDSYAINTGIVKGKYPIVPVEIGKFCFSMKDDPQTVSRLYDSTTMDSTFRFVMRKLVPVYDYLNQTMLTVVTGEPVDTTTKGAFWTAVKSTGSTDIPKYGDKIYYKISDGTIYASATDKGTGFMDTGWKVEVVGNESIPASSGADDQLVVISCY